MGLCGRCLNPPPEPDIGEKSPLPREKHKKLDVDKNQNKGEFQPSVTLTKRFGYIRDTFGGV